MIPLDVRSCVVGEGDAAVRGEVRRGVGVPGVKARFLYVWGATEDWLTESETEGRLARSEMDG